VETKERNEVYRRSFPALSLMNVFHIRCRLEARLICLMIQTQRAFCLWICSFHCMCANGLWCSPLDFTLIMMNALFVLLIVWPPLLLWV